MSASACASGPVAAEPAKTPAEQSTVDLTRAQAVRMTTGELVRLLLPNAPAGRYRLHEAGELGAHGEPMAIIRFFEQPQPDGADLCLRRGVDVHLQPAGVWEPGGDSPVRSSRTSPNLQIAAAPGCRLQPGARFASVRSADDADGAVQALRRLIRFQADARRRALPPDAVRCISHPSPSGEHGNACDRPAGELLSALALDQVELVERDGHDWRFRIVPEGPRPRQFWEATVGTDFARHPVVLQWLSPAPF